MLPSAIDGEPHDCMTVIEMSTKPRPDILDTPITNADCVFYVDGSSLRRDDGTLGTAYAVVSDHAKVEVEVKEPEQELAEAQASAPTAEKRKWVRNALPQVFGDKGLLVLPGDWVLIWDFRRKHWHSPKFRGPYEVLLATPTAVRVAERDSWVHLTHCRVVKPPEFYNPPTHESPEESPASAGET
ncbi:hypothetical protein ACEWY4_018403 [Coilia grayii]|uniref:Murine leukemia virus integrase C-terminal domain-containing protein n=1 Tax=Coilia grayii TaxID=363190 RepID=A0ABD1JG69_9TELE